MTAPLVAVRVANQWRTAGACRERSKRGRLLYAFFQSELSQNGRLLSVSVVSSFPLTSSGEGMDCGEGDTVWIYPGGRADHRSMPSRGRGTPTRQAVEGAVGRSVQNT